ncbi:hypothetical protein P3L51_06945 [Streptomyces sp. PSRA5]|uniref:hypothetical protein n=1 Tax=Streptomyces panacea TaxID=3035064 RepID=UPI00339CE820
MYPEPNPYVNPQPQPQPNPYLSPQAQPQPQPYAPPQPYAQPNPYLSPQPQPHSGPHPHPHPHPHPTPEFLAADSRSGIVIDEAGVTFDFEGRTAEFPWADIQSIHSKPGAGGHRLMVAVVLPGGKFYECGVKARNRETLDHWFRDLGHVLQVYLGRRDNPAPWTP